VKFLKLNSTPCLLLNINGFIRQKGLGCCWMIGMSSPTDQRLFPQAPCPDQLWHLTSHLSSRYWAVMSPRVKRKLSRTVVMIRGANGKDVDSREHLWSMREFRPLDIWYISIKDIIGWSAVVLKIHALKSHKPVCFSQEPQLVSKRSVQRQPHPRSQGQIYSRQEVTVHSLSQGSWSRVP